MIDLSSLNENQRIAVAHRDGPILVLAGPGSGKTRVLACRIARIVEESPGDHFCILGLTFTDKAAREMRRRVEEMVPDAGSRVELTTFHSFCAAVLRQHGHHIGLRPDFTILSQEAERAAVLEEAAKRAGTIPEDTARLLQLVKRFAERNMASGGVAGHLEGACGPEEAERIGRIYGHYRDLMIEGNELDFDGLLTEALRLLTDTPVGPLIRDIYTHVCVDEFQDTNPAQYRILRSIAGRPASNLFVVADGDQSIYGWNGANPERLQSLKHEFGMQVINLPENYRCPPRVVEMANRLIANNPRHGGGGSVARSPGGLGNAVRVRGFATAKEESEWIARDISGRPAEARRRCAVLARTRGVLQEVVSELKRLGIPGHLPARKDEFASDQIAWLHAILRLAGARQDAKLLNRVCRSFSSVTGTGMSAEDVVFRAHVEGGDYLRAWFDAVCQKERDPETSRFLKESVPKLLDRLDAMNFIADAFGWFGGIMPAQESGYASEYWEEKEAMDRILDEINGESGRGGWTLAALLQKIDLSSKEAPAPEDAVPCYTVYASKGLEFDHVYLARLVEDVLPDWRAVREGRNGARMQEERRVCFVAITRTQKSLTMTCPENVNGYEKQPSRFLCEMGALDERSG